MQWDTTADLNALVAAGVDVARLYVVRRDPEPGERRLVGRMKAISGARVQLSESHGDLTSIGTADVYLEPSRATFAGCLEIPGLEPVVAGSTPSWQTGYDSRITE